MYLEDQLSDVSDFAVKTAIQNFHIAQLEDDYDPSTNYKVLVSRLEKITSANKARNIMNSKDNKEGKGQGRQVQAIIGAITEGKYDEEEYKAATSEL